MHPQLRVRPLHFAAIFMPFVLLNLSGERDVESLACWALYDLSGIVNKLQNDRNKEALVGRKF